MSTSYFNARSLAGWAGDVFTAAGMDADKASCVAGLLVTGEMLGQRTHGIALCPQYVEQIEKGLMTPSGTPEVIRDSGAIMVWDGRYLPGPWLVSHAISMAADRLADHGQVTCVIRRSHHIACLTSLIKQATDKGLVAILCSSDPAFGFVAPFGGKEPLLTPNPIAIGYPGNGQPVWVDASTSITTVGMARQKSAADIPFDHPWLLNGEGKPTCDPHVLDVGASGTLLPVGGLEYGHKGFGLSLLVEALTQGLAGFGRQDSEKRWGANIFLQMLDPAAFAGREEFLHQMDYLTDRCHANAPIDPARPVRMPGEMEQARIATAEKEGVQVMPVVVEALKATAARYNVALPATL
ncbi:Ldh family oxidoreductase [Telmatospirillum siberiense]|uniref:Lactate dehydrogenase n=1 Tax=Telmatospirillum siberiense TaxID=382514 RepID=A0A2N3PW90_9PROT|nr:Ldh family oxidoreductase [Telmatospirillum siberiense]PKU24676.1 lactate dehydrogenase [Telmatospirillum siberiense]